MSRCRRCGICYSMCGYRSSRSGAAAAGGVEDAGTEQGGGHQSGQNISDQAFYLLAGGWVKAERAVDVCASWAGSSYKKYDDTQ